MAGLIEQVCRAIALFEFFAISLMRLDLSANTSHANYEQPSPELSAYQPR